MKPFAWIFALQLAIVVLALQAAHVSPGVVAAIAALFSAVTLGLGLRILRPIRLLIDEVNAHGEPALGGDKAIGGLLAQGGGGGWPELEAMVARIRRDLQRKSEELAREQEELTVLMASISDAILAVDAQEGVLFQNPRFTQVFGIPEKVARRSTLRELQRDPAVLQVFERALRAGETHTASIQVAAPGEATAQVFSVSATPLRRENGWIYGAVGVFHDVTELKKAERVRIDFVANVSHELRTPLTAIKGYTDTLLEDARSGRHEGSVQFLEVIARNVDRLKALTEDLLDLSSLESGVELQKEDLSTREITERALHPLVERARAKMLAIETSFDAPSVHADPRRVEQVLVNLVDNAIKYVPGGGRIRVRWEEAGPGGAVRLRVADDGPGIPPESLDRLFERFYRVDKARSREVGGTGLGLAIVKHIMQRHGGSAQVRSEPGRGAEFACEFPGPAAG